MTHTTDRRIHQRTRRVGRPGPLVGTPVGAAQLSRRELLRWAALAAGSLTAADAPEGSLRALVADAPQLSILGAQSQLPVGRSRFAFGLAGPTNALVERARPEVWFARDQTSKALGPFTARWLDMRAYDATRDRSPRSELKGFYVAEIDLPQPGKWVGAALVEVAGQRAAGQGALAVSQRVVSQVGTRARPGPSPVAATPAAAARTPLLCASRMCGPVVASEIEAALRPLLA